MPRPSFITDETIATYDAILKDDDLTPAFFKDTPMLREVLYAGFFLKEQLEALKCQDELVVRIQFTLGALAFDSSKDIWVIVDELLEAYKNGTIEFLDEPAMEAELQSLLQTDVPRDPKNQN